MITTFSFFELLNKFNNSFADYITVTVLMFCGIFFTFRTRFVQIRCFWDGLKNLFSPSKIKRSEGRGVSSFAALATAVGSQVGTGNIVGVAAAILIGGAGSVFWMWISAFFGMATIYAEAVAAQITRKRKDNGELVGGPVCYINFAFKSTIGRVLGNSFAMFAVLAFGFVGAMVQSNAVGGILYEGFGISKYLSGIVLSLICFFVFSGGINRVSSVCEKIVTVMAVIFTALCIFVLIKNLSLLPKAFILIFRSAFGFDSAVGGFVGAFLKSTIAEGTKKGLFSNEAGMGTTPHIHAIADAESSHSQGVIAMLGVFIDSFVILTLTALVMICGLYKDGALQTEGINMNNMMLVSLKGAIGETPSKIIQSTSMIMFGFSSIISWNYFGRVNFLYIFGERSERLYSLFSALFICFGCVFRSEFVWSIADVNNFFLVIPNIIALLKMNKRIIKASNWSQ